MRASRALVAVAVVVLAVLASACRSAGPARKSVTTPLLEPPAILHAGVLRVAVDAHYPPFASRDGSAVVGIDADVANALAQRLGLSAEFVDVPASQLATALAEKRADIALGGVPVSGVDLSAVTVATSYLSDGPVLFAAGTTVTPETLATVRVAVQEDSPSYWALRQKVSAERLVVVSTLREALIAVTSGKADAAAGDAVVGGYIAREYPALHFSGQVGEASPLAVMTSKEASSTEQPLRDAMDGLAATGVLDAIRGKWLGAMPALTAAGPTGSIGQGPDIGPDVSR